MPDARRFEQSKFHFARREHGQKKAEPKSSPSPTAKTGGASGYFDKIRQFPAGDGNGSFGLIRSCKDALGIPHLTAADIAFDTLDRI